MTKIVMLAITVFAYLKEFIDVLLLSTCDSSGIKAKCEICTEAQPN